METLRGLMTEKPLKFTGRRPGPEWTVSIKNGVQGFRLFVVDAKIGRNVTEACIKRLEGALVAEALHLAAEVEGTIPEVINCGPELCFRHMALELWAVHHAVTVRFGKPLSRYAAYKTHQVSAVISEARSSGKKERTHA